MAEQDFVINIRTIADATGIELTKNQLEAFNRSIASGETTRVAAQLAAQNAYYDSVSKTFKTIEAAQAKLPPAGPPGGGGEEDIVGKISHGFLRSTLHLIGIGAVYEFINEIKKSAEEINKITDSLEKQGETLVKNVQLMGEATRFAQTQADVVKIGESGLTNIADQHKLVVELQKQELSYWQQFIDSILKAGQLGAGPLQDALDSAVETAGKFEETARKTAVFDEVTAQLTLARQAGQSFDQNLGEILDKIKETQAKQKQLGPDQLEDYVKLGRETEKYKRQLSDIIALEGKRIEEAKKAAAPLAKDIAQTFPQFAQSERDGQRKHQIDMAALEQKRREAAATGDTDRVKAIEAQQRHDTFTRDQRKEELQRYVALQESIGGGAANAADQLKALGTAGVRKYESAQAELAQIYKQQGAEMPKVPGDLGETNRLLNQLLSLWR